MLRNQPLRWTLPPVVWLLGVSAGVATAVAVTTSTLWSPYGYSTMLVVSDLFRYEEEVLANPTFECAPPAFRWATAELLRLPAARISPAGALAPVDVDFHVDDIPEEAEEGIVRRGCGGRGDVHRAGTGHLAGAGASLGTRG